MVKIGPKIFLAHFVSFFVYALLHIMSYAHDFAKREAWLRYISVIIFIIIAFVVVKLKIFGLIQHQWNGPFVRFFWSLLSQILFNLADILTRGRLQEDKLSA